MTKNNDAPLAGMLVNVYLPNTAGETMFTQDDATVPARGKYYVSVRNKPYATIFNRRFNYPVEGVNRDKTYLQYNNRAFPNSNTPACFYSNQACTYRNLTCQYSI